MAINLISAKVCVRMTGNFVLLSCSWGEYEWGADILNLAFTVCFI